MSIINWGFVGVASPVIFSNFLLLFYSLMLWVDREGSRLRSSVLGNVGLCSTSLAIMNGYKFVYGRGPFGCSIDSFLTDWFWNVIALSIFALCHEQLATLGMRRSFPNKNLTKPLLLAGIWALGGFGVIPELWSKDYETKTKHKTCVRELFWENEAISHGYEIAKFFGYYNFMLGITIVNDCHKVYLQVFQYKIDNCFVLYKKAKRVRAVVNSTVIFFIFWQPLGFINLVAKGTTIISHPDVPEETLTSADFISWLLNYFLLLLLPIILYISDPQRNPNQKPMQRSENSELNLAMAIPMQTLPEMRRSESHCSPIEDVEDIGTPVQRWNSQPVAIELEARNKIGWASFCRGLPHTKINVKVDVHPPPTDCSSKEPENSSPLTKKVEKHSQLKEFQDLQITDDPKPSKISDIIQLPTIEEVEVEDFGDNIPNVKNISNNEGHLPFEVKNKGRETFV